MCLFREVPAIFGDFYAGCLQLTIACWLLLALGGRTSTLLWLPKNREVYMKLMYIIFC